MAVCMPVNAGVSIAGAILWGVLPATCANVPEKPHNVSIAGAILWGVLLKGTGLLLRTTDVSIAGAILWGVLPKSLQAGRDRRHVSIAGAILWGVLRVARRLRDMNRYEFQSQGRFFGGCCQDAALGGGILPPSFNRRGDSLGGAASPPGCARVHSSRFNRRGDSLGGAATFICSFPGGSRCFNRRGDSLGGAALFDYRFD